jgi:Mrp family chromosome partitioning ATPase
VTVFVAVVGAAPGVGKSTLCAGLTRALTDRGLSVDHFREEEILSRPAYAAVAAEFRANGVVRSDQLLAATVGYVGSATADVVIADALFPYLPSLRAWGHTPEQIAGFLDDLADIVRPVVLYLDGDPLVLLPRAAARETDPDWLN